MKNLYGRIILSRIIAKAQTLLLLSAGVIVAASRNEFGSTKAETIGGMFANKTVHRIFPAATIESYNPLNLPPTLGVLSGSDEISFVTSISSNETMTKTRYNNSSKHEIKDVDDILNPAMLRFQDSLKKYPEFGEDYPVNPTGLPLVPIKNAFLISLESPDLSLYHGVPEDYEINISVERSASNSSSYSNTQSPKSDRNHLKEDPLALVSIKASTVFGALRALETLGQLLEFGWMENNGSNNGNCADALGVFVVHDLPLHISDKPAFPYRGLMIDTARHYLPIDLILDNLDAMAMNKMNVLHWHISDSQSFPYAPESFPELAQKGAYHPKRIYTSENVRTIIQEAYLRGIRVIPEIDLPGHSNAIAASHPEVMSHCPDPSEPMNPTVPETYDFIFQIYQDLENIFLDEMVHLGGDEVQLSEACWLNDTSIAKWMIDHGMGNKTVELYEYFETHLLKTISAFGKTPIVWQEVFDLNLTIPKDTIIDVWKGFDKYTIQNATIQGHRVIVSGCWYLDWLGCDWKKFYECDLMNFTSPHKDLMIGGHASMWGEHVDASNFISRVWPRASSAAERLWHGTTGKAAEAAAANIAQRIHDFRCRMVLLGFAAGPTGPGVCPTEVSYALREKGVSSSSPSSSFANEQGRESKNGYGCSQRPGEDKGVVETSYRL